MSDEITSSEERFLEKELSSTVDHFANRMRRRIRERDQEAAKEQEEFQFRRTRLLNAMNLCRKALTDSCRIGLDTHYELELDVSDLEGWPRIELSLIDDRYAENRDTALVLSARERNQETSILMSLRSGELLGSTALVTDRDIEKITPLLKRSLRRFLDEVSSRIIRGPTVEDATPLDLNPKEEHRDRVSTQLQGENLFAEDESFDRNKVHIEEADTPLSVGNLEHGTGK